MTQPLLHFAQVGAPVQGVGGGRGPQGVRAEAFSIDPRRFGVFSQHAVVNPFYPWPTDGNALLISSLRSEIYFTKMATFCSSYS